VGLVNSGIDYKIGSRWGGHLNPELVNGAFMTATGFAFSSSCGYLQSFDAGRVMKINDLQ